MVIEYRKFPAFLKFGGIFFYEVWIDPHYEENHIESISDQLILTLLKNIYGHDAKLESIAHGFKYFRIDMEYDFKKYRLILVLPPALNYLGVRNVFRIKEKKV